MYILSSGRRTYLIFLDAPIVFSCCWFSGFSNVFLILAEGCRGDSRAHPPPSRRKPRHASGVPNPVFDPMGKPSLRGPTRPWNGGRPVRPFRALSRAALAFPSRCGCQGLGPAQNSRMPPLPWPRFPADFPPRVPPLILQRIVWFLILFP